MPYQLGETPVYMFGARGGTRTRMPLRRAIWCSDPDSNRDSITEVDFKSTAATYYAIGAIVSLQTLVCVFKELLLNYRQHDSSIAYLDLIVNQ